MPKEREIVPTAKEINNEVRAYNQGQNKGVYGEVADGQGLFTTKIFGAHNEGDDVIASTWYGPKLLYGAKVAE